MNAPFNRLLAICKVTNNDCNYGFIQQIRLWPCSRLNLTILKSMFYIIYGDSKIESSHLALPLFNNFHLELQF